MFQLCEISATGSVDTEQSVPINITCGIVNDGENTWLIKLWTLGPTWH